MSRRAVLLDIGASGPRAREGGALAGSLAARGFLLERFSDARRALAALAAEPTDVLVVDADSPALDLREFVEALRADPRTARTLIVALASGDPREVPARRELALTLAKPINADDAASRLEALVVTRQRAATNARELRGDLSQISLPDLLQLLAVNRTTGALAIDAPGRFGAVALEQGEIASVSSGAARGIKALVRLMMLTEGAFAFTYGPTEVSANAPAGEALALGPALFEATRQIDEIARLRGLLPASWAEVRRAPRAPAAGDSREFSPPTPARAEVERLLETPRSLAALLDASHFSDADLLAAVDSLRRDGVIELAGVPASDRAEVLDPPLAAALAARLREMGRTLGRVLVLLDPAPGADGALLRALGGLAGFTAAEGTLSSALPLGALGTLTAGAARLELFAVPADGDLAPLWSVFGAGAEAALVAAPGIDPALREALASELGLAVGELKSAPTARTVASALRGALERATPRR